jgi:hypothetical protein
MDAASRRVLSKHRHVGTIYAFQEAIAPSP